MRCIDLNIDTLEILGTHFSYNEKLKEEKDFHKIVPDMQQVLKICKMRILEGRIVIKHIVNELKKIKEDFFWNDSSPKIKHETLCNDYKAAGLKNVDILNKTIALQCSWIRKLYNSFHEWKLILLYLFEKSFVTSFKFHSNLHFKSNKTKFFPSFYRQIILNWKKRLSMITEVPSCILS